MLNSLSISIIEQRKIMKEVKFYFYQLEYKFEDNLMDFSLSDYFKNPLDIKMHLFDINDNKGFLKKITDTIFCFQKFRKDFHPKIKDELTGDERDIELKANESLIEETYIYLDFRNNIMIMQSNRASFNSGAFAKYIIQLLKKKFKNDFFVCKPIISKDGIEKLIHHNVIKSIDLSIATPSIALLKDLGFHYQKIAELDDSDLDRVELKLVSKRKRGLFNLETFKNFFNVDTKDSYNRFKVKASSSYEGTGEIIDMLDELYVVTEKIQINTTKVIDSQDIILKLNQIYEFHISKIKELV